MNISVSNISVILVRGSCESRLMKAAVTKRNRNKEELIGSKNFWNVDYVIFFYLETLAQCLIAVNFFSNI